MIVKLTFPQGRAVLSRNPGLIEDWLLGHRQAHGRTQHLYDMPAIGWRRALDEMVRVSYGPAGGKLGAVPPSVYGAIGRISRQILAIENHPGLTGMGVVGWTGEIIPAWPGRGGVYEPYPNAERMILLLPFHQHGHGHHITTWRPSDEPPVGVDEPDFAEANHRLFEEN